MTRVFTFNLEDRPTSKYIYSGVDVRNDEDQTPVEMMDT